MNFLRCDDCELLYFHLDHHSCAQPPYGLSHKISNFKWIGTDLSPIFLNNTYECSTLDRFFACELLNICSFLCTALRTLKVFHFYSNITITFKDLTGVVYADKILIHHDKLIVKNVSDLFTSLQKWKDYVYERSVECQRSNKNSTYQCVESLSFTLVKDSPCKYF